MFTTALDHQLEAERSACFLNFQSVVLVDEASLPPETQNPLKAIHYFLDHPKVAFVGIGNHPPDAAKANRGVTLFRLPANALDLRDVCVGCLTSNRVSPSSALREQLHRICREYERQYRESKAFNAMFDLRDLYHFCRYFLRHSTGQELLNLEPSAMLASLERNFGGGSSEEFRAMATLFLKAAELPAPLESDFRSQLSILRSSIADKPDVLEGGNLNDAAVRFKMVIDPSSTASSYRLLRAAGVLTDSMTVISLSQFPGDDNERSRSEKISEMKIAMERGSTVFMIRTSPIHASLYDVFNQHYQVMRIDETDLLYANIAMGGFSRKARVNPLFNCVVHMSQDAIMRSDKIGPFLNRFEKFVISSCDVLHEQLKKWSELDQRQARDIITRCLEFVEVFPKHMFFGLQKPEHAIAFIMLELLELAGGKMPEVASDWIRTIVQRLMQVLVPEAMIAYHNCIPKTYLEYYVDLPRFSLKALVQHASSISRVTMRHVAFCRLDQSALALHLQAANTVKELFG